MTTAGMLPPGDRSTSDTIEETAATIPRAVILVEGVSDRRALEALAARRGRVLTADGVTVVAMGGAGSIGRFLDRFGPRGSHVPLAGLYDAAEEAAALRGHELVAIPLAGVPHPDADVDDGIRTILRPNHRRLRRPQGVRTGGRCW